MSPNRHSSAEDAPDDEQPLDETALQRALRRLAHDTERPLDAEELTGVREMLADHRYRQRRLAERKRHWPLVTLLVTISIPLISWAWSLIGTALVAK